MQHKKSYYRKRSRGFTLIELLVVIGMLAILSTVVLVAVNPLRQFAQARNTERQNDVAVVLNAVSEDIPGTASEISNLHSADMNLMPCLVPDYLSLVVSSCV
jgi:prepilin-type N-terminal cleavage/methylation domain-containing protein